MSDRGKAIQKLDYVWKFGKGVWNNVDLTRSILTILTIKYKVAVASKDS